MKVRLSTCPRLTTICSVTTNFCKHLIVDAGHIAIESDLASKEAIRIIHQKRNQKYNEEDYKQLESLMYDKLSLRLQDAQVGSELVSFDYLQTPPLFSSSLEITWTPVWKL